MPNEPNALPNTDKLPDFEPSSYSVPLTEKTLTALLETEMDKFPNADSERVAELTEYIDVLQRVARNSVLAEVSDQVVVPLDVLKARLLIGAYGDEEFVLAMFSTGADILHLASAYVKAHWEPAHIAEWQQRPTIRHWVKNGYITMLLDDRFTLRPFFCDPGATGPLLEALNEQLAAIGVAAISVEEQIGFMPDASMLSAMAGRSASLQRSARE